MKVTNLIRFCVAFTILNCVLVSHPTFGQDNLSGDVKLNQRVALIEEEVSLAAKASYRDYALARIEALAREHDLDATQLAKPKIFARKVAADQLKQCKPLIVQFLNNEFAIAAKAHGLLDSVVSVNGKTITSEKSNRALEIEIDLRKRWISAHLKHRGHGGWLEESKPVDFRQSGWQSAFAKVLSPSQLSKHQQTFEENKKKKLAVGSVRLATDFRFSPEQEEQAQDLIYKFMELTNQSTVHDLKQGLHRQAGMMSNVGDEFLSDSQRLLLDYADGSLHQFKSNDKVETIESQTVGEAITAMVRQEIHSIIQAELQVEIDDYIRLLKPTDKSKKRWTILIKEIAHRRCESIFENSKPALASLKNTQDFNVVAFAWKGVRYQVKDPDEDGQFVQLRFGRQPRGFRLSIELGRKAQSLSFNLKSDTPPRLVNNRRWQLELSKLQPQQLDRFETKLFERKQKSIIDGVVAALSVDLILSIEQEDLLRKHLASNAIWRMENESNFLNAINTIKQIQSLDFLSESQQSLFRIAKSRLR
jgi:hypothetical protein